MSGGVYLSPCGAIVLERPATNGGFRQTGLVLMQRQALPTDPIGNTTVTFSGVQAGTEIRVYLPDGTEAAGVEECVDNQSLTWPVYSAGSPNNGVFITLLKRGFRWQRFPFQSVVGNQTIPIFQIPDLGWTP